MTNQENMVFDPPTAAPPKGKTGCFIKGCAALVVLVILVIGGCGLTLYSQQKKVGPICERYFSAMEAGNYEEVYKNLAPNWKKTQTKEQFIEFGTFIKRSLGNLKTTNVSGITVNSTTEGTVAVVTYIAEYDQGSAQVIFTLRKFNAVYLIEGARYNSDRLVEASKCPHCGVPQAIMPKFCPSCGKEWSRL